jgi:poly-gamma-glutamate capsule biosynthesis protein CapA/YwtB (metallophosphatase superfamily)
VTSWALRLVLTLLVSALFAACTSGDVDPTGEPTELSVATAAATVVTTPTPVTVAVQIADPAERDRIAAALGSAPSLEITDDFATATMGISDLGLNRASRIVLARWAAITDQRRDVLELTRDEVVRALRGDVADWSEFGGSAMPITPLLPVSEIERIASALGIPPAELPASVPDDELLDLVQSTPGALALIQPEQLRLGVLALVVDGHDPYRDPANDSPLLDARWVTADSPEREAQLAAIVGLEAVPDFDPAGMIATGELIPARCTYEALESLGRLDAMFDGTGELIAAADIAVSPLEVSLTDLSPPTPCVATFVLQGPAEAATVFAEAGIDVVITAGNHAMDCWEGCNPTLALLDTIENLANAGLVSAGAGANLGAARAPAIFTVQTLNGPVSFAFLAYDSIAAAFYGAGPDNAGTAPLVTSYLQEDIAAALPLVDHVLVGAGWGVEYTSDPIGFQQENALAAIEAGATVVLGNHPHWVQAVEHASSPEGDDRLIAYSFGNFVFDQDWSVETTQGMAMELGFTADRLLGYRIRPVVIYGLSELTVGRYRNQGLYRPEFVDPATEGRPILDRIWDAQDRLPAR